MTLTEYKRLFKEVERTRNTESLNVDRLANGICSYMQWDRDSSPADKERIDILYKKLGEAIGTEKVASDVADYCRNDVDICIDAVLDRLKIKSVDVKEMLEEEKEDEYI